MKGERKKYCYRDIEFPKAGLAIMVVFDDGEMKMPYPVKELFTRDKDVDLFFLEIKKQGIERKWKLLDSIFVLPLIFEKKFLLKRKYWRKSTVQFTLTDKIQAFFNVFENPDFYKMLVLDMKTLRDGEELLYPAIPIPYGATDSDIEKIIMNLSAVVEETVKYAAIYTIGKPYKRNINEKVEEEELRTVN